MYGSGQLIGGTGGGGSKAKFVEDIAERNSLVGKIGDNQMVIVRNAIDDPTVDNPDKPRATYVYHKDGIPTTWEKLSEEESVDLSLFAQISPNAVTVQKFGDIPAGTKFSELSGRPVLGILLDMLYETVYHSYVSPTASTNVTNASVEAGALFNQSVVASFAQNDAGSANRVQIQVNETDVQDTSSPALDYTYDDNNVVLGAEETRRYRTILNYDEGPVINDTSGKGLPSPGNVAAGSVTSATRTKTARNKIFFYKSTAKPTTSNEVRALSWQWDNDNSLEIDLQNGETNWGIIIPPNKAIVAVWFDGAFDGYITNDVTATEETIKVEGGSNGAVNVVADQAAMLLLAASVGDLADRTDTEITMVLQGSDPSVLGNWINHSKVYKLYHVQPATPYTASKVTITFETI